MDEKIKGGRSYEEKNIININKFNDDITLLYSPPTASICRRDRE